jgi:predicted dehydrogenase
MIRLGIAGVQHPHVEYVFAELARRADVRLVAISERDPVSRAECADRFGVPTCTDHRELFGHDLDVVAVADEYGRRGRVVIDCLRAGAHVLADKPLCTSLDDLDEIETVWRGSGRELSVMLEKRGSPPVRALTELVTRGVLGEITLIACTGPHKLGRHRRPQWFFDRTRHGGILGDLAVHDLDLLLRLTNARTCVVRGWTGNRGMREHPGFEDHGLAVVHTEDRQLATFEVHWMSPEAEPSHGDYRMRLTGTKGTAELFWEHPRLVVATHDRTAYEPVLPPAWSPAGSFFDAISACERPVITAEESLAATRLALTAQRSADLGGKALTLSVRTVGQWPGKAPV